MHHTRLTMQIVLSELGFELSAELQARETPPCQEWPNRMALHTVRSVQLLNCARGQATTISVLQDFAAKHENLILLLQEPWCDRHGNPPSLPGFDIFTPSSSKAKCVTYIRQTQGLTGTTVFTAQDSFLGTMITTPHNQKTFALSNFYSPGRAEPLATILPTLKLPNDCLLMGDLNAHHPWWRGPLSQSARISRASYTISIWLENNHFHLQNKPAIPTHHPRNGRHPSTIDLCLSPGFVTQCIQALAMNHDTTSDHSALTVTLSLSTAMAPAVPCRCWRKDDWKIFDLRIQSANMDLSHLHGMNDTLHAIANITRLIHQAVDKAVPVRLLWKTTAPWWNHSLTLAKQSVKRADRLARLHSTKANKEDSQYMHSKWSIMVRNAKTAYCIRQLETTTTWRVWKTVKHHNTHHKPLPPLEGKSDFPSNIKKAMYYGKLCSPIQPNKHHFL